MLVTTLFILIVDLSSSPRLIPCNGLLSKNLGTHTGNTGDDDSDIEGSGVNVVRFFLATGIVPSLFELESKKRSLPKEEPMPVVSALEKLFYYRLFTQLSIWYPLLN